MENKIKLLNKLDQMKSEIDTITKEKYNSVTDSNFADINVLLKSIEPIARKNGLLILQPIQNNVVSTVVVDLETGEQLESSMSIPATIVNPQQIGSCVTYFRRYTLKSLLALQEADDDANVASGFSILSNEEMDILDKMAKRKDEAKVVENNLVDKLKNG